MDSTIIGAILSTITALVICGIEIKASQESAAPSIKKIRHVQLSKIFEPIEQIFLNCSQYEPCEAVNVIYCLLTDNLKLVPIDLLTEVTRLKSIPKLKWKDLHKLHIINCSMYNWHCKHFGYPYEPLKIVKEYTPTYNTHLFFRNIRPYIYLAIAFVLSIISLIETILASGNSSTLPDGATLPLSPSFLLLAPIYFLMILSFLSRNTNER